MTTDEQELREGPPLPTPHHPIYCYLILLTTILARPLRPFWRILVRPPPRSGFPWEPQLGVCPIRWILFVMLPPLRRQGNDCKQNYLGLLDPLAFEPLLKIRAALYIFKNIRMKLFRVLQ